MAQSLINYVKNNPVETAINVATLIPAVGGVIKGGSLLYKASKTINKVYNKGLKEHKQHRFNIYLKNLKNITKKTKEGLFKNKSRDEYDAGLHKLEMRNFYKNTIPGGNSFKNYMQSKPEYLKNTLLTTKKAQVGSGLIVGGIGTTAHLRSLQK